MWVLWICRAIEIFPEMSGNRLQAAPQICCRGRPDCLGSHPGSEEGMAGVGWIFSFSRKLSVLMSMCCLKGSTLHSLCRPVWKVWQDIRIYPADNLTWKYYILYNPADNSFETIFENLNIHKLIKLTLLNKCCCYIN